MNRSYLLILLSIFVLLYFVFNIWLLQISEGSKYFASAISNNFSRKVILPQRGFIYDSNGELLAGNKMTYDILLDSDNFSLTNAQNFFETIKNDKEFEGFLYLKSGEDLSEKHLVSGEGFSGYKIIKDLPQEKYDLFFEKHKDNTGIIGVENYLRTYDLAFEFAHVLGYLGAPNETDETIYGDDNRVRLEGKSGIEEYYDSFLEGKAGQKIVYKSLEGKLEENTLNSQQIGSSVHLTIDKQWQIYLYKSLENQMLESEAFGSAGIVMESDTGEVKALVSLPSFDSNKFNLGIAQKDFEVLLNDPKRPLVNKVVTTKVSPGSTIKPLVALFAIEDGVVDPTYEYVSRGCESLGGDIRFCEADGRALGVVDLSASLYRSSNLYFCSIAKKYDEKYQDQGIQFLLSNFDELGIADKTGIDINGEVSNTLPSPERIQRNYKRNWSIGDSCNMVIGQGDVSLTPVKLVTLAGMLHNGGSIYKPYIVKNIVNEKDEILLENLPNIETEYKIDEPEYFEFIRRAMRRTVSESNGTANSLKDFINPETQIKTGSADAKEVLPSGEILEGAHSWVMGNFEKQGKKYSFAFVQYYGGRGFETLPVVKNFLNCVEENPVCEW